MNTSAPLPLFILSLFLMIGSFATAQDSVSRQEHEALRAKVERLETVVAALKATQIDTIRREVTTTSALRKPTAGDTSIVDSVVDAIYTREQAINYPWMDLVKWNALRKGMSPNQVAKILGAPTRDEPSLHKRIDNVFTYEGRQPSTNKRITGKVRFRKDQAVEIELPRL